MKVIIPLVFGLLIFIGPRILILCCITSQTAKRFMYRLNGVLKEDP